MPAVKAKRAKRPAPWNKPRAVFPDEHTEQVDLINTLRDLFPGIWPYVAAVPNGGARHPAVAGKLKAEGVRAGYPDIVIDCARGPFHGMRVELKRQKKSLSTVSDEQKEWGARLNLQDVLVVVGRGAQHAIEQIQYYWSLGEFDPDCVVQMTRFELLGSEP